MLKRITTYLLLLLVSFPLFSQSAKQHIKAGEQFLSNGLLDAAVVEFRKASVLEPNDGETYVLLAQVLLEKGDSVEAANHFQKAAALGSTPDENLFKAGKIYYAFDRTDKAELCISKGLELKPKNFDLLLLKTIMEFDAGEYSKSFSTANEAIKSKDKGIAYFYSGVSARKLGNTEQAKQDLEKAIIQDHNMADAYIELGDIQLEAEEYEYAVDNFSMVLLLMDPQNTKALRLRSKTFHAQKEPDQALLDITKAIALEPQNWQLHNDRAQYNMDFAFYRNAIDDYSVVLSKADTTSVALLNRANCYEKLGLNTEARNDYSELLKLLQNTNKETTRQFAQEKVFELGREQNKPEILIEQPTLTSNYELNVKEGSKTVLLSGKVNEETKLKNLTINSNNIDLNNQSGNIEFGIEMETNELDFVTISATDIYDNVSTVSYPIRLIETQAPIISLISPAAGLNDAISLESGDNTLYIEGKIEDKSYITQIKVDEINASFAPGDYNPRFTATIDIKNRKNITITATDAFGNETEQTFEFFNEGQLLSSNNPMGKTWVVILENTDYKEYSNLISPKQDMMELTTALDRYKISKILHKKNLSKRELERFFAIDLRDLIISNNVKSLLIWYAGHGQNMNNTGYWIPVDGRPNDEYSFYNVNALKASLYSYSSLTHILVVSDACKAGESFSIAMRGDNSLATCDNDDLVQQKSALILTSSNSEPAMDNSLFTKTFINTLANNPADCIPIDAVAERISITMYKHTAQKPVFGRISGLEDQSGTFFFISK